MAPNRKPLLSVCQAAGRLRVKPKTILNVLYEHADQFPVRYLRIGSHPRKHRGLTEDELGRLKQILLQGRHSPRRAVK